MGGPIGPGGAECRLPVLVGWFRLTTLEAVICNKALSLAVATAALPFGSGEIPLGRRSRCRALNAAASPGCAWARFSARPWGAALLGAAPSNLPMAVLGLVLPISAVKALRHTH